jgi:hypothetical protein
MFYRTTFDAKISSADYPASFDFAQDLTVGETLTTVSTTATVYSGADATPSAILFGAPTVSGKQVVQNTTGGVLGTVYYLFCAATTSLGQVLTREGYLPIVPEAL